MGTKCAKYYWEGGELSKYHMVRLLDLCMTEEIGGLSVIRCKARNVRLACKMDHEG